MSRRETTRNHDGFNLIELLLVITIIGLLAAMVVPSLVRAKRRANDVKCQFQIRQMSLALMMYLDDSDETIFWHGGNLSLYGMDWYVYGGRETGNRHLGQVDPESGIGLFNRFQPRPLNPYLRDQVRVFQCPFDTQRWPWAMYGGATYTHYNLTGNSYAFNATGYPAAATFGLAGQRLSSIAAPDRTAVFFDTTMIKAPFNWHDGNLSSFGFADGHVEFTVMPSYDGDRDILFQPY